jgi:hypothetical protein
MRLHWSVDSILRLLSDIDIGYDKSHEMAHKIPSMDSMAAAYTIYHSGFS